MAASLDVRDAGKAGRKKGEGHPRAAPARDGRRAHAVCRHRHSRRPPDRDLVAPCRELRKLKAPLPSVRTSAAWAPEMVTATPGTPRPVWSTTDPSSRPPGAARLPDDARAAANAAVRARGRARGSARRPTNEPDQKLLLRALSTNTPGVGCQGRVSRARRSHGRRGPSADRDVGAPGKRHGTSARRLRRARQPGPCRDGAGLAQPWMA